MKIYPLRQFKHMQALDPVDVDYQKKTSLVKYYNELERTEQLFTNQIRDRTIKLMSRVSIVWKVLKQVSH